MVLKLTSTQSLQVHDLVRSRCANCINDKCLLLNDCYEQTCVQLLSYYGIYCNYFLKSVLPCNKELYKEILFQNK